MNVIRIITRNSKLAMWQATHVKQLLVNAYPELTVEVIGTTTEGDQVLDQSLSKIGGKGLFVKELEAQLLKHNADIAVHSLKDLPTRLLPEFDLAAILARDNPCDALLSKKYKSLDELPIGSIVGTSSPRREAILLHYYPHLEIKLLRGNVGTRIAKLDAGEYDAIILAVAGLKRLDLTNRISCILSESQFIPAIGQGAIAIEVCKGRDDLKQLLEPLHDEQTFNAVSAEREMGNYLNASCNLPIAGFASYHGNQLVLQALVADKAGKEYLFAQASGHPGDFEAIGRNCAKELLSLGAAQIVNRFR